MSVSKTVVIGGASMAPTLDVGDVVVIDDAYSHVRPGDVVVITYASGRVCHRVIIVVPVLRLLVHRGDAPGTEHGLARLSQVSGRVRYVHKRGETRPHRTPARRIRLAEQLSAWHHVVRAASNATLRAFQRARRLS